jgi:hypothetical protein
LVDAQYKAGKIVKAVLIDLAQESSLKILLAQNCPSTFEYRSGDKQSFKGLFDPDGSLQRGEGDFSFLTAR